MATLEQWIRDFPPVTRVWLSAALLTTASCSLDLLSPFDLYYDINKVVYKSQYYRIITCFLYFSSTFNLDYIFHLYFLCKYSRGLEENYEYKHEPGKFCYMILYGCCSILLISSFIQIHFLGQSLTFMIVYIWSKKNKSIILNFLGIFNFTANYLPWILCIFSLFLGHNSAIDILGIIVGHIYYFLTDIYPVITSPSIRLLRTPLWFQQLFIPHEQNNIHNQQHPDIVEVQQ